MVISLLLPAVVVAAKLRWSPKFPEIDPEVLENSPVVDFSLEEELTFGLSKGAAIRVLY